MTAKWIGRCLALALSAAAGSVSADKVYRCVDADGKVTYQEKPPCVGTAEAEEKTIDPKHNVIQMEVPQPSPTPTSTPAPARPAKPPAPVATPSPPGREEQLRRAVGGAAGQ